MASRRKLNVDQITGLAQNRPYVLQVMQTQILFDIAGLMEELVEGQNQLRSDFKSFLETELWERYQYAISDVMLELYSPNVITMPWTKFTLFNDGPDDLYMAVNSELKNLKAPIRAGESLPVDKKKAQIRMVRLQCIPGETTSIRIFAQK